MSHPHPNNACAAHYADWLEVHLLPQCNAKCVWCVEQDGFCPDEIAPWQELVENIKALDAINIILLGGEPTLHPFLKDIVDGLHDAGKKVWLTTNGSMLTPQFCDTVLKNLTGLNLSHHHPILNHEITGLQLDAKKLQDAIETLHFHSVQVRFNCNCISGYVDSIEEVNAYIGWARMLGADKVRFAELKVADHDFIDLVKLFREISRELPEDPYRGGCSTDLIINGMPVNVRTMCGFQTPHRPTPVDPIQSSKHVMYRDGNLYKGWQKMAGRVLSSNELAQLFRDVASGRVTADDGAEIVRKMKTRIIPIGG